MPSGTDLLGDAIRAARMKKGYTQEVFAEMLDITPVHLANIEGSRRKPSVPLLFRMMELLNHFLWTPWFFRGRPRKPFCIPTVSRLRRWTCWSVD